MVEYIVEHSTSWRTIFPGIFPPPQGIFFPRSSFHNEASGQASKPGKEARKQGRKEARKQGSKEASKQACKPASKGARGKGASTPVS